MRLFLFIFIQGSIDVAALAAVAKRREEETAAAAIEPVNPKP